MPHRTRCWSPLLTARWLPTRFPAKGDDVSHGAGYRVLAALSGETKRVLDESGCGIACGIEDAEGLARICCEFEWSERRAEMGAAARAYYMDNFTKERFFNKLEGLLRELIEKGE